MYVTGQIAQIVHQTIDTKVVAMQGIVASVWILITIGRCSDRSLLVERQLTDTVDGIVDVFAHLSHTILGALQHHARAEHATEVGTLDGVQQTSGIDRTEAVRLKTALSLGSNIRIRTIRQFQIFFFR